jgi:hypothetical protein
MDREPAVFGLQQGTARDEVFMAIKRTFQALDDEILNQARTSGTADCQFGGTTALMALQSGHVRAPSDSHSHSPPSSFSLLRSFPAPSYPF